LLELDRLLKSENKKQTEEFLLKNFSELPEELRQLIVFTFVSEGAMEKLKEVVGDYTMQTAALEGLGEALEETGKNS